MQTDKAGMGFIYFVHLINYLFFLLRVERGTDGGRARDYARQQINLFPCIYTLSQPIMHAGHHIPSLWPLKSLIRAHIHTQTHTHNAVTDPCGR